MSNEELVTSGSGSGSGSGIGSIGGHELHEDYGSQAGVGTGCGRGDECPQHNELTTLEPGVYVVTQKTTVVMPTGTCLVAPFGESGRGSGNGEGVTLFPDARACESLITSDKEEAEKYFSQICDLPDIGCNISFGDGTGAGCGSGADDE